MSNETIENTRTPIMKDCLLSDSNVSDNKHQNSSKNLNENFGLVMRGLRIGNLNVCHVLPKLDEIKLMIKSSCSVNILGLCETFLNESVHNDFLNIDGFVFERKDRDGGSGGGLLLYVCNDFNFKRRYDLETQNIETIWAEIMIPNSRSILLCSAYRPPSAPVAWVEAFATEVNNAVSCDDNEIILMGDFNIDLNKDPPSYWTSALETFNLSQVINTNTRVTANSNTLIDHIYTNRPDNIQEVNVPYITMSDHFPICITRRLPKINKKSTHLEITYRDFKNFDEFLFLQDLANAPFQHIEQFSDVNNAMNLFFHIFLDVFNKHASLKTKRVKTQTKPTWLTPEINEARHKRDYFHKKLDFDNYKIWRNKVTTLIIKAKENYFSKAINENKNTGDIWRNMKQIIPKGSHSIPNKLCDGETEGETKEEMAKIFNQFYANISKQIVTENISPVSTLELLKNFTKSKLTTANIFEIQPILEEEVHRMLKKLQINKSAGIDNVGPRILKLSADIIAKPITHLLNLSISTSKFPDNFKVAKIIPIYKKGDKTDPGNYRPISLLPTISKLFEKHVTSQVYNFLTENDLLMDSQSGFRKLHSCQTALTRLTEKWIKEIDDGNMTGTVLLDLRKAFDLVNHPLLLEKMKHYNFDTNSLQWFKSYLSNRSQVVQIGNTQSGLESIYCGVPQGSVLGPILFLIYINDLPLHVKNSLLDLFADDATLHHSGHIIDQIESNLNDDILSVKTWCDENKMAINENKSKCLLIGSRQRLSRLDKKEIDIEVNGKPLQNVEADKLLGVTIDNNLQFNKHISEVCRNISCKISLLRRIKRYLNKHYRKLYFNAYILPSIDYCLTIYGNASKTQLDRVHKLQKSAARVIMDAPPDSPSQPLFDELGWLNIYDRCMFNKGVLLYKIFNNLAPPYLCDLFSKNSNSLYTLRSVTGNDLQVPRHKTESFKRSLQYSGVSLWNELPSNIKEASSLFSFKNCLYKFLFGKGKNEDPL
ncbi:hypothetical protein FSP39_018833 [Pinctada imbricata]|uniref:Reverse transcriptase domain-containing protein n=1 Tax=Pinctada imbricata TaxID=66713 RepID=A0AA89C0F9_PINIB|nr:hypothetical protein FSP39_018833 [Pinctada imbricata]